MGSIIIKPNVNTKFRRQDTKNYDTQHYYTQHYDTQHCDTQHDDTQHDNNEKMRENLSITTLNTKCCITKRKTT
jgi:hypothetical protein